MEQYFAGSATQIDMLVSFVIAAVLGGLIGIERELARKPAGFRTLMIVAGTSSLLMSLGTILADDAAAIGSQGIDPSRVIQAIVMGIGFICAGTIIRHRAGEHIEGLTTSAVILAAASIGISVAMHQLLLAIGVTVITLVILVAFRTVENLLARKNSRPRD